MKPVSDALTTGRTRQVTFPRGETGFVVGGAYTAWETDYQPVFSPDGKRVAYIHAVSEVVGNVPGYASQPSLRIVDVNGANDIEVLRFHVADYVTHVSWSPDGRRLVFDLGPQAIGPDGFPYLMATPDSDFLYMVNTNGSGFTQLLSAPATWPAWSAAAVTVNTPPRLTIGRSANPGQLLLSWPVGANFILESSPQLGPGAVWQPVGAQPVTNGAAQFVTVSPSRGIHFYRLRSP